MLLGSCTHTSPTGGNQSGDESEDDFNFIFRNKGFLTENQKEFEHNYFILNTFYLFAHSDSLKPTGTPWYNQLGSRTQYVNSPETQRYLAYDSFSYPSEILDTYYMYESLQDKFTFYEPPQIMTYDEFLDDFEDRPSTTDLGVNINQVTLPDNSTKIVVEQIYKGSAAELANVKRGDTIIAFNGVNITDSILFHRLTESYGSVSIAPNVLTVNRPNSGTAQLYELPINFVPYIPPTVTYKIIDSIAVISILEFANNNTPSDSGTYGEFIDALRATENTKSTIIDLRDNPGGDENQCISIASEFLNLNDTIAGFYRSSIDSITYEQIIYKSFVTNDEAPGLAANRYVVFMTNKTASCAELTLMSVASNKKTPIVGKTTYGKGSGYTLIPTYLKGTSIFTFSMIIDKNQETYHTRGIDPDIQTSNDSQTLNVALQIAKEQTMTRTAGYSLTTSSHYNTLPNLMKKGSRGDSPNSIKAITRADLGMYKTNRSKKFHKIQK